MQVFIWVVLVEHTLDSLLAWGNRDVGSHGVTFATSQRTSDVKVSVITLAGVVPGFSRAGAWRGGKQELAEMHH